MEGWAAFYDARNRSAGQNIVHEQMDPAPTTDLLIKDECTCGCSACSGSWVHSFHDHEDEP